MSESGQTNELLRELINEVIQSRVDIIRVIDALGDKIAGESMGVSIEQLGIDLTEQVEMLGDRILGAFGGDGRNLNDVCDALVSVESAVDKLRDD